MDDDDIAIKKVQLIIQEHDAGVQDATVMNYRNWVKVFVSNMKDASLSNNPRHILSVLLEKVMDTDTAVGNASVR